MLAAFQCVWFFGHFFTSKIRYSSILRLAKVWRCIYLGLSILSDSVGCGIFIKNITWNFSRIAGSFPQKYRKNRAISQKLHSSEMISDYFLRARHSIGHPFLSLKWSASYLLSEDYTWPREIVIRKKWSRSACIYFGTRSKVWVENECPMELLRIGLFFIHN